MLEGNWVLKGGLKIKAIAVESSAPEGKSFQARYSSVTWAECLSHMWGPKADSRISDGLDTSVSGRTCSMFAATLEQSF